MSNIQIKSYISLAVSRSDDCESHLTGNSQCLTKCETKPYCTKIIIDQMKHYNTKQKEKKTSLYKVIPTCLFTPVGAVTTIALDSKRKDKQIEKNTCSEFIYTDRKKQS